MENSLVRSLVRKKKENRTGRGGKRRLTTLGDNNEVNEILIPDFLKRLMKSMVESLYLSLYARLYREMLLAPECTESYGDIAHAIVIMNHSRESAVTAIMNHVQTCGKLDPNERSPAENGIIFAVLNQKSALKDKLCKGWPLFQYRVLCRQARIIKVKALTKVCNISL